ncbi:hypothetical protein BXY57_0004 [Thermoflavifilum aggregans]|uniref:Uncharacterized protein n=1 Tax=Thermoflavifilum aggregans TaxID=454188 RepID=A0A2M9CR87_9BACT|nr:hypothetical protein [Thermoflavifilum aggregans]PJJ74446.1 hypothetical protein BXY57_0004 [Thermoflavifilum aggregans]
MKNHFIAVVLLALVPACTFSPGKTDRLEGTVLYSDTIQYHPVRIDTCGAILPWFSSNLGQSYDTCLMLVWNFWKNMEIDSNGLKYYMNHQVWAPHHDMRGVGGDQFAMALSSWRLLYAYTGDKALIEDMRYIADEYLARGLSKATDQWPFIPYPYNTVIHSGLYDGDMRNGKNYTQPDKAGSFGTELINLFKITGEQKYLDAAINIGKTLASKTRQGDNDKSPLPFRVNAVTGEPGSFFSNQGTGEVEMQALYTSNWTGTLELFQQLQTFDPHNADMYKNAFVTILEWMKNYPLRTNKWGPFFEDIPGWSDTQINAITFAMFIMENKELFPDWKKDVKGIFDWTYKELGNHEYEKYKVTVMNEQTVYQVPGNSHSSRQASTELWYTALTGDTTFKTNAIRALNWATYTVADDGRNRYIRDDVWLTDGYGDYVRHYLRAMAAFPELAPDNKNRLVSTSSVVKNISYEGTMISYETYDAKSTEKFRLIKRPAQIMAGGVRLQEMTSSEVDGYVWTPLARGGILQITKSTPHIEILF